MIKIILLITFLIVSCKSADKSAKNLVTIGTGSLTGVYYPTGGAIAKLVNENTKEHKINVSVQSTGGSVFNVNSIMSEELDFGIVQSDRQYQAYQGLAEWKDNPKVNLRAVFSIHYEAVTLVTTEKSEAGSISDLKNKRINIGNIGSGQRQNALDALEANSLSINDIKTEEVKASDAPTLLQDGRIDAFFYTVGHPNGTVKSTFAAQKGVQLIPMTMSAEFYQKFPYYAPTTILAKHYPEYLKEDIPTFGVKATFCTRQNVPEHVVYRITKSVFENFEVFKTLNAAYEHLTKEDLLTGMSAPIHPGALKYYKESGLDKYLN